MSKYADDMKQAILRYKSAQKAAESRIKVTTEDYGQEAGQRELERQEKMLKAEREKASAAIREAYSEGLYLAEQWGKPDGSRLTDDLKLFDAGIVTPEVFDQLKTRYKDNATMLSALKAQGEKLNAAAAQAAKDRGEMALASPYDTSDIVTSGDKVENWKKLKAQALDALDMIDGTGNYSDPWAQALGNALGDEVIDHFGEGMAL
jgi:hypothetical protein